MPEASPEEDQGLHGGPDDEDFAAEAEARLVDGRYRRIIDSQIHWGSRTMSSGLSALNVLPLVVIHFSPAQLRIIARRVQLLQEHLQHHQFDFEKLGVPIPELTRILAEYLVLRQKQGRKACALLA